MTGIGIMQGRLSPPEDGRHQCFPRQSWRDEFSRAAAAGLIAIEWIWDARSEDENPLRSDHGIGEIKALSERHMVAVRSVCADYFMAFPLVRVGGENLKRRQDTLDWLITRCALAGIERIVLPFLDASRIESSDDRDQVITVLLSALPTAEAAGVGLHLETSLAPGPFAELLGDLPHPLIRVNYDSGNSASLGYRPTEEFRAYGARVGSIHLKDRTRGGGTVSLGTGDAEFETLALALRETGYDGDYILEAARGRPGDEIAWSRQNRLFAEANVVNRTNS